MSFIQQFFTSRDNNANAETFVGQQGRLWWDPVSNQIYSSDGNTPGGIPLAGGGGGNGTPGGSNSQIQFNNNGAFGGTANLTINSTTGALTAVSFLGDGSGLFNITGSNVVGEVAYAAVANSVAGANVAGEVANATYATTAGSATTATSATTAATVTANAQPNITSVGILSSVSVAGNVDAGGLYVGGSGVVTGNLQIQGNLTYNNLTNITTANLVFGLANTSVGVSANGAGWVVGNTSQASWLYNYGTQQWDSNIGISAIGDIIGSNITTGGLISASGNITGGNVNTAGLITATGNITGGNLVTSGILTVTGNANVGNLGTAGLITATGNITGGNINTAGAVRTTGSMTLARTSGQQGELTFTDGVGSEFVVGVGTGLNTWGGPGSLNLITSSSPGGNIGVFVAQTERAKFTTTGLNVTGLISATSNVSGGYFIGNGSLLTGITSSYGNANVVANLAALGSNPVSTTGNVTAGYFIGDGSQLTGISTSSNIIFNGTSNVEIATADGNATITTAGASTWTFDTAGTLNLPGGNIVQAVDNDLNIVVQDADNDDFALQTIVDDGAGTTLSRIRQRRNNIQLGVGLGSSPYYWEFVNSGTLRLPGDVWGNAGGNLTVLVPISGADSFISLQTRDNTDTIKSNINVTTTNVTISTNTVGNTWVFDSAGNLTLPSNTASINYANGTPYGGSGGASLPLANGTSNFDIATANGNATITANGANTWTFDTTGTLTVPTIATGDGTSEVSAVSGSRKIIGSVNTWSTYIDGHSAFGALAWTASSSLIQSAKITFVVQSNGTAYNWEQFDVAICRLDGANAYVSVSGRVKQNSAIDYTDVSGYVSGGSLQVWLNPADGQTSAYINYNSVEFNIMPD